MTGGAAAGDGAATDCMEVALFFSNHVLSGFGFGFEGLYRWGEGQAGERAIFFLSFFREFVSFIHPPCLGGQIKWSPDDRSAGGSERAGSHLVVGSVLVGRGPPCPGEAMLTPKRA